RRRAFHLFRRLLQLLRRLLDFLWGVSIAEPAAHAIEKRERVSTQFFLAQGDGLVSIFTFLIGVLVTFANQTVRRGDQIFLPARQSVLILIATTLAAALLLRLLVLHLERFHFDKVDVARGFVARVASLRVIRNKVAGFEVVFFKEERVGAGERACRLTR